MMILPLSKEFSIIFLIPLKLWVSANPLDGLPPTNTLPPPKNYPHPSKSTNLQGTTATESYGLPHLHLIDTGTLHLVKKVIHNYDITLCRL